MRLPRPHSSIVLVMIAATALAVPETARAEVAGDRQTTSSGTLSTPGRGDAQVDRLPKVVVARSGSSDDDSRSLRRDFVAVLRKYPPALGKVLKLDPSLMTNAAYLAPYPLLSGFVTQHPEIVRNPAFFFEDVYLDADNPPTPPETPGQRMLGSVVDGLGVLLIFGTIMFVVTWLVRSLLDYRRWTRQAKVQAETHAKLLDRLTANNELIAYVESPAGSQFLQSAPIALEPGARRLGAPVSRILWSVQAGVVLLLVGWALQYLSGRLEQDVQQPFFALGVLGLALGVGFLLSAGAAWAISHKLGLFEGPLPARPSAQKDGAGA